MEKAVLKTLIYADIFDYPLKAWEIHKWLIAKKASLNQIEKALKKLGRESRIKNQGGYYFLPRKQYLVGKRLKREQHSQTYLRQTRWISRLFKLIPWIKLVGISGSLAMDNATSKDDIDLMVVTAKNRLWLSRICLLVLLELIGKRRKKTDSKRQAAGKLCVNLLLDEDSIAQGNKDIYLAHEVLQMKPLWYRDNLYQKYLEVNDWVFKLLPNWITTATRGPAASVSHVRPRGLTSPLRSTRETSLRRHPSLLNLLENLARWWQLKYMGTPQGLERISRTALYFHPEDYHPRVLATYAEKLAGLDNKCQHQ